MVWLFCSVQVERGKKCNHHPILPRMRSRMHGRGGRHSHETAERPSASATSPRGERAKKAASEAPAEPARRTRPAASAAPPGAAEEAPAADPATAPSEQRVLAQTRRRRTRRRRRAATADPPCPGAGRLPRPRPDAAPLLQGDGAAPRLRPDANGEAEIEAILGANPSLVDGPAAMLAIDFAQTDVCFKLDLHADAAAAIVGVHGATITTIRDQTNCRVKVLRPGSEPNRRVLELGGSQESALMACGLVLAELNKSCATNTNVCMPSPGAAEMSFTVKMLVRSDACGCIIGKGGNTISTIRQMSHANIKVEQAEGSASYHPDDGAPRPPDRSILFTGSINSVHAAMIDVIPRVATCAQRARQGLRRWRRRRRRRQRPSHHARAAVVAAPARRRARTLSSKAPATCTRCRRLSSVASSAPAGRRFARSATARARASASVTTRYPTPTTAP